MTSRLKAVLILFAALSLFILISSFLAVSFYPGSFSEFIYKTFSLICHQHRELCLELKGHPMPLCSRCIGLYLGALISNLFVLFFISNKPVTTTHSITNKGSVISLVAAILWGLIFLDSRLTDLGIISISHVRRFAIGLAGGISSSLFILFLFSLFFSIQLDQKNPENRFQL
jgi:uncharacterized membrane protein